MLLSVAVGVGVAWVFLRRPQQLQQADLIERWPDFSFGVKEMAAMSNVSTPYAGRHGVWRLPLPALMCAEGEVNGPWLSVTSLGSSGEPAAEFSRTGAPIVANN